jgi:hypothetical protein
MNDRDARNTPLGDANLDAPDRNRRDLAHDVDRPESMAGRLGSLLSGELPTEPEDGRSGVNLIFVISAPCRHHSASRAQST